MKYIEQISAIIREEKQLDQLDPETELIGQGILDSFDIITLVARLEQEFDITIDGEHISAETLRNVGTISAMLEELGSK